MIRDKASLEWTLFFARDWVSQGVLLSRVSGVLGVELDRSNFRRDLWRLERMGFLEARFDVGRRRTLYRVPLRE